MYRVDCFLIYLYLFQKNKDSCAEKIFKQCSMYFSKMQRN